MRFEDLEHIVRASAALLDDEGLLDPDSPEFIIVGSAAILVLAYDYHLPAKNVQAPRSGEIPPTKSGRQRKVGRLPAGGCLTSTMRLGLFRAGVATNA